MKNKHLVILFLFVLLTGLISRYSPWFKSDNIQSYLIKAEKNEIRRISILNRELPELLLEADDRNWYATQDDIVVGFPDSLALPLLDAISSMKAVRILDENSTDTTGLVPGGYIEVTAEVSSRRKEHFRIGNETMAGGKPGTFVQILPHGGIYLVEGHLRQKFNVDCQHFRSRDTGIPDEIVAVRITRTGVDTVSTPVMDIARQTSDTIPGLEEWLGVVRSLNNLPYANPSETGPYDIEDGADYRIELTGKTPEQNVRLDFYGIRFTKGDDQSVQIVLARRCLLHSSANEYNYFFLENQEKVRRIISGPGIRVR